MLNKTLAFALLLCLAFAGTERPAEAAMITGGTDIDLNNGYQCVEVGGGYTTQGSVMNSWQCWGGFNQQWNFFRGQILGIGSEINGQGATTNLNCMDIAGSSPGSPVVLNKCTGAASQQWAVRGGAIVSVSLHLCLDLGQGFATSGVQLMINTCSKSLTQLFAIR